VLHPFAFEPLAQPIQFDGGLRQAEADQRPHQRKHGVVDRAPE
jgi:hypothetical protein